MQNQTPEIQAKLLAMQRQIQQQQQQNVTVVSSVMPAKPLVTPPVKSPSVSITAVSENMRSKNKPLSQEQKDDQMR